jgi:hypothetical protein
MRILRTDGTAESFIDRSGVVFEKERIGRTDVPIGVGALHQELRSSLRIRCLVLLVIGITWYLGCPTWLVFIGSIPVLYFVWRKRLVAWKPPESWIDSDGSFVKGTKLPKNVVFVPWDGHGTPK